MKVHVRAGDVHLLRLETRMPFRYGIATMTHTPHAFVRLWAEIDGALSAGVAADHLPPKWFTKDPARGIDDEVEEMLGVIEHAVELAAGLRAVTPFDAWQQMWVAQDRWGRAAGLPPLLTHFGTSLVERALLDAACRRFGTPFHAALHTDRLGLRLGEIHAPLAGRAARELLPERPLGHLLARHTVGLADPLADGDVAPGERLADGLPQSLEACVHAYGLRHFKVKVHGELEADRNRLRRVTAVLAAAAPADFACTLDGNEQFKSLDAFRDWWDAVSGDPELTPFFRRLLFVEQPFHRDIALHADAVGGLAVWPERPPLIIDESDGELISLPRALALGYRGTSHKNCKGVFKGVANACLLAHLRAAGEPVVLSGEDLANVGPVALLQDLAVCAALGIGSVERNGHHYFAGLSQFPAGVQQAVLCDHGDLYHAAPAGWPTLTIRHGALTLRSVNEAPFGVRPLLDVEQFTPAARWRASPLR